MLLNRTLETIIEVIVVCFEVFVNRPSTLMARAITWSNYKHHNTVKFLIGITPQRVISFLSKAWGGRVSNKYLTEHRRLLKSCYQEMLYWLIGGLILRKCWVVSGFPEDTWFY